MDLGRIIISPIISEKSMKEASLNKFSFKVIKSADKKIIKRAIEKKFGVDVLNVYTTIVKGKARREGKRREEISLPSFKKAIVLVKEGQKIGIFDLPKE
ncbi:MAG: 50S ribosomal protein L23 [Candidatus Levybacteria bacterium]|nr:50S ribosomal protein L23 [Candidatus Levybacteria bacterium]